MTISIEEASELEWALMMDAHKLTAWESLSPERQSRTDWETVAQRAEETSARIRADDEGLPNDAFVARSDGGEMAGFVWVMERQGELTGWKQAFVLDLYVAEAFRGQGLGRRLLRVAEDWGKIRGCVEVALSVADHNTAARSLYEITDYQTESLRMAKAI